MGDWSIRHRDAANSRKGMKRRLVEVELWGAANWEAPTCGLLGKGAGLGLGQGRLLLHQLLLLLYFSPEDTDIQTDIWRVEGEPSTAGLPLKGVGEEGEEDGGEDHDEEDDGVAQPVRPDPRRPGRVQVRALCNLPFPSCLLPSSALPNEPSRV